MTPAEEALKQRVEELENALTSLLHRSEEYHCFSLSELPLTDLMCAVHAAAKLVGYEANSKFADEFRASKEANQERESKLAAYERPVEEAHLQAALSEDADSCKHKGSILAALSMFQFALENNHAQLHMAHAEALNDARLLLARAYRQKCAALAAFEGAEEVSERVKLALDTLGSLAKIMTRDDGVDPEAFWIELTPEQANLIREVSGMMENLSSDDKVLILRATPEGKGGGL